jgi:autotransporter-associated beta strand protein
MTTHTPSLRSLNGSASFQTRASGFLQKAALKFGSLAALALLAGFAPAVSLRAQDVVLHSENFTLTGNQTIAGLVVSSNATTGLKVVSQIVSSNSTLSGLDGAVANLLDTSGSNGGTLEFNAGSTPLSAMAVSFELLNTVTGNTTQALNVSLTGWNIGATTQGSASNRRLAHIEFEQNTTNANPRIRLRTGGTSVTDNFSGTYVAANRQLVKIYANDNDTTAINYYGADGAYRSLPANSFAVFLNGTIVTMSTGVNTGQLYAPLSATAVEATSGTITATVASGVVTGLTLVNGGNYLTQNGTFALTFGTPGTGATGTATLTNGVITAVALTNGGSGYTAPAVTLAPPVPAGNATLGRFGFTTSSAGFGNWLIDNVVISQMDPNAQPPATPPTITSASTATGFAGVGFSYQIVAANATSYAQTAGTLPAGLSLDTSTGVISGTPTTLGGPTTVTLTATGTGGTSTPFNLDITIASPVNTFTGSNPSLNTTASWSLGQTPTSTANTLGSYQDITLASSATDLTTISGNFYAKSWNVTNGSSYTVSSTSPTTTAFRMGNTGATDTTPFNNSVSGVQNDLVYLTGNSNLTIAPTNPTGGSTPSTVELRNSGNLNIGAGSTLTLSASVVDASSRALTKTGAGTAVLSAANTYRGGTTLNSGTLTLSGSAAPTTLVRAIPVLSGGTVASVTVVDGGSGYTIAPAITFSGGGGTGATATATISGGVVTAITVVTPGANYTTEPLVNVFSTQSPLGTGAVTLAGGTLSATVDTDLSRLTAFGAGTPFGTYFRTTGTNTTINGPVTINVADGVTVSSHTLAGNSNSGNVVTKSGNGTLWLRGGGAATVQGGWNVTGGTLFVGTSASSGLGTGKVSMNGGNLRFSKGISSTGTYSGHGQDIPLEVLQDTTITLDSNPLSAPGANTVSFTGLTIGSNTINLVKSATTSSSANSTGNLTYTDPVLTFNGGNLTGTATFNTGALTQLTLLSASGNGGVVKTGPGRLTLGSGNASLTPNSYTGATAISQGTLTLNGNNTSAIALEAGTVLELNLANPVVSTSTLSFVGNNTVSIVGTPVAATTYNLVTAAAISGTPALSAPITGFSLVNTGTILQLTPVSAGDTTKPIITLNGNATVTVVAGTSYTDAGATATDETAPANPTVTTTGTVNAAVPGVYTLSYDAVDAAGNAAITVTRTVTVVDTTKPVITLSGNATVSVTWGATYTDAGATATDETAPANPTVITSGTVNTAKPGTYILSYNAVDAAGNAAITVTRTVTVAIANSTTVGADGYTPLMRYALGANGPSDTVQAPVTGGTSSTLTLTAVVRTDDPKLTVVGKTRNDLVSGTWATTGVSVAAAASQAGVPSGCVRNVYTVTTASRTFLRLEATLLP